MNLEYINTPNGDLVVKLRGEMDAQGCTHIRPELEQITNSESNNNIILNLSQVSFLDSSGVGVIVFLYVVPLHLPPLRERGDDIMEIAEGFLITYAKEEGKGFKSFTPEVEVILHRYNWPGNVRQLQNVIRNIVVLHDDQNVSLAHLPPSLNTSLNESELSHLVQPKQFSETTDRPQYEPIKPLANVEREAIERAIDICDGNIPKAAALLEVSPSTIYRKKQGWESDDS